MHTLDGRSYSEGHKGEGDTISEGKRSQSKVRRWTGTGIIGDQEVSPFGLSKAQWGNCREITMAGKRGEVIDCVQSVAGAQGN